jgi:hypothetical protein
VSRTVARTLNPPGPVTTVLPEARHQSSCLAGAARRARVNVQAAKWKIRTHSAGARGGEHRRRGLLGHKRTSARMRSETSASVISARSETRASAERNSPKFLSLLAGVCARVGSVAREKTSKQPPRT